MTLNRKKISKKVHEDLGYPRKRSDELLETLLELIRSRLEAGEDVLVSNFGKFRVTDKSPRKGRNPQTGEDMILDARRIVTFKCSGSLKGRMNGQS